MAATDNNTEHVICILREVNTVVSFLLYIPLHINIRHAVAVLRVSFRTIYNRQKSI